MLSAISSPAATLRLIELALWEGPPSVARCHPAFLLVALLSREELKLLALPPTDLKSVIAALRLETVQDAERIHVLAHTLTKRTPKALLSALDAAWCAGKTTSPPYVCAWLDPAEVALGETGGGIGRSWVVDLRPTPDFDRSHFALTLSLPPTEARSADSRHAARLELMDVCSEGHCGIAFLTPGDPLTGFTMSENLTVEETRTVVQEFIRDGFRHVGIIQGGFAALSPEQRKGLVSDGFTPDAANAKGGAGAKGRLSRVLGGVSALPRLPSALMGKRAKAAPN